jgi:hypothetical protein
VEKDLSCKEATMQKQFEFRPGQRVRDLNGRIRKIVRAVRSVAYELDRQPNLLYQTDEIELLRERRDKRYAVMK